MFNEFVCGMDYELVDGPKWKVSNKLVDRGCIC